MEFFKKFKLPVILAGAALVLAITAFIPYSSEYSYWNDVYLENADIYWGMRWDAEDSLDISAKTQAELYWDTNVKPYMSLCDILKQKRNTVRIIFLSGAAITLGVGVANIISIKKKESK